MPEQDHDYVDFMGYDADADKQIKLCRVYLTKGKLSYEGIEADHIKKVIEENPLLDPFRKIGGYSLLSALPQVFKGSYIYATEVKEAYEEKE